jgi:putative flippase GtrA
VKLPLVHRVARCLGVSVATTLLSAGVLVGLVLGAGMGAGPANVVAVCCGIPVSYVANRRWTWRRTGRGSVAREVVPFWILSLAGLLTSTLVVTWVSELTAAWSDGVRAAALPAAEAATFAVLWLVQFAVLDRLIFRPTVPPIAA